MPITDSIADMLTIIRNAVIAKHRRADIPASRVRAEIARVLLQEKYLNNVKSIEDEKQGTLRVYLRYTEENNPVIQGIQRVSKPGRRVYVKKDEIPRVLGGLGTAIVSTPQGIMTDKEARNRGVGGELLAKVW